MSIIKATNATAGLAVEIAGRSVFGATAKIVGLVDAVTTRVGAFAFQRL